MPATFHNCPACSTPTSVTPQEKQSVIAVYRACTTCGRWHRALFGIAVVAAVLILIAVVTFFCRREVSSALNALGILLTAAGGYLVFGKLDLLLLMGRTLGGFHEPEHMQTLSRETLHARVGLVLILAGLTAQAWF